jgi:hypothetical protein
MRLKTRQFKVQLILRTAGLFITLLLLAFGLAAGTRYLLLGVLLLVIALQLAGFVRFVNLTNRELESFLAGLRFGDFQQTYSIAHLGPSFQALEQVLRKTVEKFKNGSGNVQSGLDRAYPGPVFHRA